MSAESELLIKIRTALESGGLDQAKNKLKELTEATKDVAGATGKHDAEAAKAAHTLHLFRAAANGNVEALTRLIAGTDGASASLTKAIPVLASFWAGWEGGKKIGDVIWSKVFNLQDFDRITGSIRDQIGNTIAALKEMDKVKMSNLLNQLNEVVSTINIANEKLGLSQDRETTLLKAKQDVEKTALEKGYAGKEKGPAYDRDRTTLEKKHAEETLALRIKQINDSQSQTKKDEAALNEETNKTRSEEADAFLKAKETAAMAAEPGATDKDRAAAIVAKTASDMATQRRKEQEDRAEVEYRKINSTRYKNETARQALYIGIEATDNTYQGSMTSASAAEQAIVRKQAEAQEEADRKTREQAARDELGSLKGEETDVEGQLGSVRLARLRARSTAQTAGASSGKSKFNPRSFSAPKAEAQQISADAEKAFSATEAALMAALQRITQRMETLTSQIKNSPRGGG